jgi:hypothetical protein
MCERQDTRAITGTQQHLAMVTTTQVCMASVLCAHMLVRDLFDECKPHLSVIGTVLRQRLQEYREISGEAGSQWHGGTYINQVMHK